MENSGSIEEMFFQRSYDKTVSVIYTVMGGLFSCILGRIGFMANKRFSRITSYSNVITEFVSVNTLRENVVFFPKILLYMYQFSDFILLVHQFIK